LFYYASLTEKEKILSLKKRARAEVHSVKPRTKKPGVDKSGKVERSCTIISTTVKSYKNLECMITERDSICPILDGGEQ
jgi:hypothetical protein